MGIEQLPIIDNTSQAYWGNKALPPSICKDRATKTEIAGGFKILPSLNREEVSNKIPTVQIATSTPRLKRIIFTTKSFPKNKAAIGMAKNP